MQTGRNIGNCRGPVPGNKGAVRQHQAQGQGYVLPVPERRVDVFQRETDTGETSAPGLTTRNVKRRM
jgi:hypothetical protein